MLIFQLKIIILDFFLYVNRKFSKLQKNLSKLFSKGEKLNITKRIENLCTPNKISIAELERRLDFGNGTIRRWVTSFPSIDKLAKVADYFHVGIAFLYSGKEEDGGDIAARKFNKLSSEEKRSSRKFN